MPKQTTKKVPVTKGRETKSKKERPMIERERYWSPFEIMRQFEREMDDFTRSFDSRFGFPRRWREHDTYHVPTVR